MTRVRVPQLTDIETAIKIFYERHELSNKDIKNLFGSISSATVCKLKNRAREQMEEDKVPCWNANLVNTEAAYKAWGLEIDRLERSYAKLKKLGMS